VRNSNSNAHGIPKCDTYCSCYCDTYSDSPGYGYAYSASYGYAYGHGNAKLHPGLRIHIGNRNDRAGSHRHWKPLR
jgi:hypothetical protein